MGSDWSKALVILHEADNRTQTKPNSLQVGSKPEHMSVNICLYLSDEHSLEFQDTGPPLSCCGSQTFRLALLLQNLLQRPQGNSTEGSHFQRALVLKGYYKDKNSGGILWPISDRCRSNFHSSWPLVFKADSHFLELLKLLPET